MRIEGTIAEIDLAAQKLLVCGTHLVFRADARRDDSVRSRCVDVRVGAEDFDLRLRRAARCARRSRGGRRDRGGRPLPRGTGETLVLDAAWIQQGGFDAGIAVTGEILTGVVGDEFTIAPDPEGPIATDELTVRLFSGAKLFNRAGESLAPSDLEPGLRVRVFGVLAGAIPSASTRASCSCASARISRGCAER